jgi:hypothetical protein
MVRRTCRAFAGRAPLINNGRMQLILAAAVGLTLSAAAAGQTHAGTLPAALRSHLTDDRFGVVTSVRGLPLGVREALQKLFGTASLELAEPGADFQATDVMSERRLPVRRLAAAGCSRDHCVVYYQRGGIAQAWRVVVFRWTPEATKFEWGGAAAGSLRTIEDVRGAILSGKITTVTSW